MKVTPDILFIHPNASEEIYQDLSKNFSAKEPPIWAAMLANHVRTHGFEAEIMDCEALEISDQDAIHHVKNIDPWLIVFVVYGQQPSASSQNMEGAVRLAEKIKNHFPDKKILFVGNHVSALTKEVMESHSFIDFACQNEGVLTISDLLQHGVERDEYYKVRGLAWRTEKGIALNPIPRVIENLVDQLPGMAWDLLPMDHYRTSLWHSFSNDCHRGNFASIYTSLGCPFQCHFCMINAINKYDVNMTTGKSLFRYWDPEFTIKELEKLAKRGITNLKIADELFVLNPAHFLRLCDLIIEKGLKFNIWCYARVDVTKPEYLVKLKQAGVNWLALGIESASSKVRKDVIKGRFADVDISSIVKSIRDHGINVIGNYIFGLPEDDRESMLETLDLAVSMNTEEANFYSAMAYPGSKLYNIAIEKKWKLPETYAGYSQHSYYTQPLPTKYLMSEEVLRYRDLAWKKYHTDERYLNLLKDKFGEIAVRNTLNSTKVELRRKILGD